MGASLSHIISQPRFTKAEFNLCLRHAATLNGSTNANCIFLEEKVSLARKCAVVVDEGHFPVRKACFACIPHTVAAEPNWLETMNESTKDP